MVIDDGVICGYWKFLCWFKYGLFFIFNEIFKVDIFFVCNNGYFVVWIFLRSEWNCVILSVKRIVSCYYCIVSFGYYVNFLLNVIIGEGNGYFVVRMFDRS